MKRPLQTLRVHKKRKRAKRLHWSTRGRYRQAVMRRVFHLPTRSTLTYAEAQRFVDVYIDGSISRLNILEPLCVVDERDIKKYNAECCTVQLASETKNEVVTSSLSKGIVTNGQQVRVLPRQAAATAAPLQTDAYYRHIDQTPQELNEQVEYDTDEQDIAWLGIINAFRRTNKLSALTIDCFEHAIDRFEKESFAASLDPDRGVKSVGRAANTGPCAVCAESDARSANLLLVCDACSLTVHQDCYGVPYVADGTWVCRSCLRCSSQSMAVCCLCPVTGGALKQTDDGRFAHIVCARWIPEVRFGSTVYMEPVQNVSKVPSWRRRLLCSVCELSGCGACIRCEMPSCTNAFHAMCAHTAGIYMCLEPAFIAANGSRSVPARRFVYCNLHRPVETSAVRTGPEFTYRVNGCLKSSKKVKKDDAQGGTMGAVATSLHIPTDKLSVIADELDVRDQHSLISCLHSYWLLKRHTRHGLPLLHRIQYYLLHRARLGMPTGRADIGLEPCYDSVAFLRAVQKDFEKVQYLLQLVIDRETMKRQLLAVREDTLRLQLEPLAVLLRHTLQQLQAQDSIDVFALPVPLDEVVDYLDKVRHPMDLSTMRDKVDRHCYTTFDSFADDFDLIISNCLQYNEPDSYLHHYAIKMHRKCECILNAGRRMAQRAQYSASTGLHSAPVMSCLSDSDLVLSESDKASRVALESQLKLLLSRLDVSNVVRTQRNVLVSRRLRRQIGVVRRRLTQKKREEKQRNLSSAHNAVSSRRRLSSSLVTDCTVSLSPLNSDNDELPVTCLSLGSTRHVRRVTDRVSASPAARASCCRLRQRSDIFSLTDNCSNSCGNSCRERAGCDATSDCDAGQRLRVGDLVWTKTSAHCWFPALVVCEPLSKSSVRRASLLRPPHDVMVLWTKHSSTSFLVRLFDKSQSWRCVSRSRLERLGCDSEVDHSHISASEMNRSAVRSAYNSALQYRRSDHHSC